MPINIGIVKFRFVDLVFFYISLKRMLFVRIIPTIKFLFDVIEKQIKKCFKEKVALFSSFKKYLVDKLKF